MTGTECGSPTAATYTSTDYITIDSSASSCSSNTLYNTYCGSNLNTDTAGTVNIPICGKCYKKRYIPKYYLGQIHLVHLWMRKYFMDDLSTHP